MDPPIHAICIDSGKLCIHGWWQVAISVLDYCCGRAMIYDVACNFQMYGYDRQKKVTRNRRV